MKYKITIIVVSLVILMCCKKDPHQEIIDEMYKEYVDGEYNGRYYILFNPCSEPRFISYFSTIEGATTTIVPNTNDRYRYLIRSGIPIEETPWHLQKLKSGKYLIYCQYKQSKKFYLWNFERSDNSYFSYGFSNRILLERHDTLPPNPSSYVQFGIQELRYGGFNIMAGSFHVVGYLKHRLYEGYDYDNNCNVYPATEIEIGGPVATLQPAPIDFTDDYGRTYRVSPFPDLTFTKVP